jgi:hypothetical protein
MKIFSASFSYYVFSRGCFFTIPFSLSGDDQGFIFCLFWSRIC